MNFERGIKIMRYEYLLGEKFLTNCNLDFKGVLIKENSIFEILEKINDEEYKVYFYNESDYDNVENIQILNIYELDEIRKLGDF